MNLKPRGTVRNGSCQSPRQKEAPMSKLKIEEMAIILYDSRGEVHEELVSLGVTVNIKILS
jgi:hypothetical protein